MCTLRADWQLRFPSVPESVCVCVCVCVGSVYSVTGCMLMPLLDLELPVLIAWGILN